jgi:hypothetical protein
MDAGDRRAGRRSPPGPSGGGDDGAQPPIAIGILIVLMTSALVVAIWGVARGRLVAIVESALDTVCGPLNC